MIRRLFLAAAITMAAATFAQAPASTLESIVAESAAHCPVKLDRGATLDAIKLTATALEFHLVIAIPAAQFPLMEQNMGMMRPTLLQVILQDPEMKRIATLAADKGLGLRIVIVCADNRSATFALEYSEQELADAAK